MNRNHRPWFIRHLGVAALAVLLLAQALGGEPAHAQAAAPQGAWPSRVVRILLPYAAGAGPSVFVRILADRMGKDLGQQIIVDARPGASGFVALELARKAHPDGHDLVVMSNAHATINPFLYRKVPYDMEADFSPIGLIYLTPFFVTVASQGPYRTVGDLVAAMKAAPGRLTYGTPYVGSPADLGGALFEHLTGTRMIHVPFKDQPQIYPAIANGDVDWALSTLGSALPLLNAGKVKLLAIAGKVRSASAPNVPTIAEAGGPPELLVESWMAMFAPRGTSGEIIHTINATLNKALADPEVLARMKQLGFEPTPSTPDHLAALVKSDSRRYAELIRRTGATAEP
jgi:tripartite-type tricarboxylate transporter receptor subunit TctC